MSNKHPPNAYRFCVLLKSWLFSPILTGATLKERLLGCLGALVGICLTGFVSSLLYGNHSQLPLIVAPIGASAVLLFAVPASPLAQPWSIIGGNTISALVGVSVLHFVDQTMIAVGLAVSLAILAMSLTRSLHPPGGAAALTAVIGGDAIFRSGFWFPFVPVAMNSIMLVAIGIFFHQLSGRKYPHRQMVTSTNTHNTADPPSALRVGFNTADIDGAISNLNETLDISRADVDLLVREVELQALLRQHGEVTCADIMSQDIISVSITDTVDFARHLLLEHDIRTLPVFDSMGRLKGIVGLRELATVAVSEGLPFTKAPTARPSDPAIGLLPRLTDGIIHAVIVLDEEDSVVGIISQTDLLAALARSISGTPSTGIMKGYGQGI